MIHHCVCVESYVILGVSFGMREMVERVVGMKRKNYMYINKSIQLCTKYPASLTPVNKTPSDSLAAKKRQRRCPATLIAPNTKKCSNDLEKREAWFPQL